MRYPHARLAGFSLVELSIVLVILGLLTGGILAGKSLIRASELRSVATEYTKYRTAFYSFRDKYFALPGDMPNAVQFWGAQAGATMDGMDTTCRDLLVAATSTATCNGNGNGKVLYNSLENYETYRTWQHLANAGMIEGSYTGVTTSATPNTLNTPVLGSNTPASKMAGTGYTVRYYPSYDSTDPSYFAGSYGNLLLFGIPNTTYTSAIALIPEEAWNIDTKLDDGKPGFGKIVVPKGGSGTCHTNTDPTLSDYNLSRSAISCNLMMLLGI